jgi:hypothetical protein
MDADTTTLQLLLESELAVAALEAGIASSSSSRAPRDPVTQRVAEQLAAVLVRESHLFDAAGTDLLPAAAQQHGLVDSVGGVVCSVPLSVRVPLAEPLLSEHSCTGSNFSSSICEGFAEWCASPRAPAAATANPHNSTGGNTAGPGSAAGVCHDMAHVTATGAGNSAVASGAFGLNCTPAAAAAASYIAGPFRVGLTNALVGMTNSMTNSMMPAGGVAGSAGVWVTPACNSQAAPLAVCGVEEWDRQAMAIEQELQALQCMRARVCKLQCNVVALKHDLGL